MTNPSSRLKVLSRVFLVIAALLLAATIFLPIWQIELYAPQYPEGLELLIYADSLAGDVDIINGLNHYIGMQTLHTENFFEFSIIKYILIFFAICFITVAIIGRKKPVYVLLGAFLLFAIVSMIDFYRWNYDYGHNLDPHAAIKVPGMAYQPPLIGYKQLLNFGAYSIPDTGGILMIIAGLLILFVVLLEGGIFQKIFKRRKAVVASCMLMTTFSILSCTTPGPRPVKLNQDMCEFCKMTITDVRFATQLTTRQGRHYIFDDITCMIGYKKSNPEKDFDVFYVADFSQPSNFIPADQATLFHSDSLRSPMGGNIAGFAVADSSHRYQSRFNGTTLTWSNLLGQE